MNKNEDRGMLKWQPFYSVLSEKEIKKDGTKVRVCAKCGSELK